MSVLAKRTSDSYINPLFLKHAPHSWIQSLEGRPLHKSESVHRSQRNTPEGHSGYRVWTRVLCTVRNNEPRQRCSSPRNFFSSFFCCSVVSHLLPNLKRKHCCWCCQESIARAMSNLVLWSYLGAPAAPPGGSIMTDMLALFGDCIVVCQGRSSSAFFHGNPHSLPLLHISHAGC